MKICENCKYYAPFKVHNVTEDTQRVIGACTEKTLKNIINNQPPTFGCNEFKEK